MSDTRTSDKCSCGKYKVYVSSEKKICLSCKSNDKDAIIYSFIRKLGLEREVGRQYVYTRMVDVLVVRVSEDSNRIIYGFRKIGVGAKCYDWAPVGQVPIDKFLGFKDLKEFFEEIAPNITLNMSPGERSWSCDNRFIQAAENLGFKRENHLRWLMKKELVSGVEVILRANSDNIAVHLRNLGDAKHVYDKTPLMHMMYNFFILIQDKGYLEDTILVWMKDKNRDKIRFVEYGAEEGSVCYRVAEDKVRCRGIIKLSKSENCSCHISAPCSSCTSTHLYCDECGWSSEDEDRIHKESIRVEGTITGRITPKVEWPNALPKVYAKKENTDRNLFPGVYDWTKIDYADIERRIMVNEFPLPSAEDRMKELFKRHGHLDMELEVAERVLSEQDIGYYRTSRTFDDGPSDGTPVFSKKDVVALATLIMVVKKGPHVGVDLSHVFDGVNTITVIDVFNKWAERTKVPPEIRCQTLGRFHRVRNRNGGIYDESRIRDSLYSDTGFPGLTINLVHTQMMDRLHRAFVSPQPVIVVKDESCIMKAGEVVEAYLRGEKVKAMVVKSVGPKKKVDFDDGSM